MHTTRTERGTSFVYNGDFRGDVIIIPHGHKQGVTVPADCLIELMGKIVRDHRVSLLEHADPRELLFGKPPRV